MLSVEMFVELMSDTSHPVRADQLLRWRDHVTMAKDAWSAKADVQANYRQYLITGSSIDAFHFSDMRTYQMSLWKVLVYEWCFGEYSF